MNDIGQVPICLSGSITAIIKGVGICMDGATHEISALPFYKNSVRLKASNEDVRKSLDSYTDAKVIVTVCGYLKWSGTCTHIDVYYCDIAKDFYRKLSAIF